MSEELLQLTHVFVLAYQVVQLGAAGRVDVGPGGGGHYLNTTDPEEVAWAMLDMVVKKPLQLSTMGRNISYGGCFSRYNSSGALVILSDNNDDDDKSTEVENNRGDPDPRWLNSN